MHQIVLSFALILGSCGLIGGCPTSPSPATASETYAADGVPPTGTRSLTLSAGGFARTYSIHIPAAHLPERNVTLVMILHGTGETGLTHLVENAWIAKSETAGFVAVAPDALPMTPDQAPDYFTNPQIWNAAQPYLPESRRAVDDSAFLETLVLEVAARIGQEPRIFLTGHSGGGGMAFRFAAERSEMVAALAVVASPHWQEDPRPSLPMPTLLIVGDADPFVPQAGGERDLFWFARSTPPVTEILDQWAAALGCAPGTPLVAGGAGLTRIHYQNCPDGAPFDAIIIAGHGHRWPGGRTPLLPDFVVGPSTNALNATDMIWEFYAQHTRQGRQ